MKDAGIENKLTYAILFIASIQTSTTIYVKAYMSLS
jgi:hypothetical protein